MSDATRDAIRVAATAKVNLVLRILAREAGGFHQLETVFQRLALADDVTVRVTGGARRLDITWDGLPPVDLGPVEQNLAWRAAAAYQSATGFPGGFEIAIRKRIPAGGGLGGGSADAGAVLRALDALNPSPVGTSALLGIGGRLGADVPFLTADAATALGWGRGERMLALPPLPARDVLVLIPPFGVNTAEAYRWLAASRGDASGLHPGLADAAQLSDWARLAPLAVNEFEPVVFARHPELATAVEALSAAGARIARMSGSGATVFGVFDGGAPAVAPPGAGWRVVRTRTATAVPAATDG